MASAIWIKLLNEGISLFLLGGLGLILYRGFKRNQILLLETEDLVKRYLLFRGDKQARLKIYGEDEIVSAEILKTLSTSWKNFKKSYDQCLLSLSQNTNRTKLHLQLVTLGLVLNSARLLIEAYYFYGLTPRIFLVLSRELSSYVLVLVSFFLVRTQSEKFLSLKGNNKADREILFFPNGDTAGRKKEILYDEFDPLESMGAQNGKKDQNTGERTEG